MNEKPTVNQWVTDYLSYVALSRLANTTRTYRNVMRTFLYVPLAHKLQPDKTLVTDLHKEPFVLMATAVNLWPNQQNNGA